jgi:hypothetical protein
MTGTPPTTLFEDQTLATAGGTYVTGGIKVTLTKCSQLLFGSLTVSAIGCGYVGTPVSGSEIANTATCQFWVVSSAAASVAGTVGLVEAPNGFTGLIGQKFRFSYQGV